MASGAGRGPLQEIRWLLVVVAAVILAASGSAFVTYLMFGKALEVPPRPQQTTAEAGGAPGAPSERGDGQAGKPKPPPPGPTYDAGEFVVNLASAGLMSRYLRVGVVMEVDKPQVVDELEKREPQVRHQVNTVLRSKRPEEINSPGIEAILADQIREAVNQLLASGQVVSVYFPEMVMQ